MSNHSDLQSLSKQQLIEKIITARGIWHQDQQTIESLTDQVGKAVGDIEKLNAVIEEKDALIDQMQSDLHQAADKMMTAWCRLKDAYRVVERHHKTDDDNPPINRDNSEATGRQHASAPSK